MNIIKIWRFLTLALFLTFVALLFNSLPGKIEQRRAQTAWENTAALAQKIEKAIAPYLENGEFTNPGEISALLQSALWQERMTFAAVSDANGNVSAHTFGIASPITQTHLAEAIQNQQQPRVIAFSAAKQVLHVNSAIPGSAGLFLHVGTPAPNPVTVPPLVMLSIYILLGCALLVSLPSRKRELEPVRVKQEQENSHHATPPRSE